MFKTPFIAIITIISYLNMVFYQLSSTVAMDSKDAEWIPLQQTFNGYKEENISSFKNLSLQPVTHKKEDWENLSTFGLVGKFFGTLVDPLVKAVLEITAGLQGQAVKIQKKGVLPYAFNMAENAVKIATENPLDIIMAGGTIAMGLKPVDGKESWLPFGVTAVSHIKQGISMWQAWNSLEEKQKERALRAFMWGGLAYIILSNLPGGTRAAPIQMKKSLLAISATNLNQDLNYTTNGSPVFFKPIVISGAYQGICEAYFLLADYPNAGTLYSNGTLTIMPSFKNGEWVASGNCNAQVQPLLDWLAFYPATGYGNSPVRIFDSISDGVSYVNGQINIFRVNTPPSTLAPTTSQPTILPTMAPTTSQPTVPITLSPTSSQPTIPPTMMPTPIHNIKPFMITVAGVGVIFGVVSCIFCSLKAKKKSYCCMKDKEKDEEEKPNENSPLI